MQERRFTHADAQRTRVLAINQETSQLITTSNIDRTNKTH